jgi:hypothetical protein
MAKVMEAQAGEWMEIPGRRYKLICCDCGLAHDFEFRVVKGKIRFRAYRNERSTAACRRERRKREGQQ